MPLGTAMAAAEVLPLWPLQEATAVTAHSPAVAAAAVLGPKMAITQALAATAAMAM
jgi:hypothetical protein